MQQLLLELISQKAVLLLLTLSLLLNYPHLDKGMASRLLFAHNIFRSQTVLPARDATFCVKALKMSEGLLMKGKKRVIYRCFIIKNVASNPHALILLVRVSHGPALFSAPSIKLDSPGCF